MKKLMLLLAALFCLPLNVSATPLDELTGLAVSFPADTLLFMSVRIDDEAVETIDTLIEAWNERMPMDAQIDATLAAVLDEGAQETLGGPFSETVRPWLGDTMAFGLIGLGGFAEGNEQAFEEGDVPLLAAVEITDREAADAIIRDALADSLESGEAVEVSLEGVTYYQSTTDSFSVLLNDSALYLGTTDAVLDVVDGFEPSLVNDAAFVNVFELLPEAEYDVAMYIDYGRFFTDFVGALPALDPMTTEADLAAIDSLSAVYQALGGVAFGFTLLDGRTLTMDTAVDYNEALIEDLTVGFFFPPPLDPSFVSRVSDETAFYIQGVDLKTYYETSLESFEAIADQMNMNLPPDEAITPEDIEAGVFVVQFFLRRYTGLNLESDILSWMDRDYALVLGMPADLEVENIFGIETLPAEFGLIFDATSDPEAAARTVDGIEQGIETGMAEIEDEPVTIEMDRETLEGAETLVVTITDDSGQVPFPVELLAAANDDTFVLGTRGVVETALRGDGGFTDTIGYREAAGLVVDAPVSLAIYNSDALLPLVDLVAAFEGDPAAESVQITEIVLDLITSATISSNLDDSDGTSAVSRATITLFRPE